MLELAETHRIFQFNPEFCKEETEVQRGRWAFLESHRNIPIALTWFTRSHSHCRGFHTGWVVKNLPTNAGDLGLIPGLGRSPEEGKGYPFQYPCLENSMDCIVHGVTKSQIRLNAFHFPFISENIFYCCQLQLTYTPWSRARWGKREVKETAHSFAVHPYRSHRPPKRT